MATKMRVRRILIWAVTLLSAVILIAAWTIYSSFNRPYLHTGNAFNSVDRLSTGDYTNSTLHLFDFGVADQVIDDALLVYALNHSESNAFFELTREARFVPVANILQLEQNPQFPDWVNKNAKDPERGDQSGIYIYWSEALNGLVIRSHGQHNVAGLISLRFPISTSMYLHSSEGLEITVVGSPSQSAKHANVLERVDVAPRNQGFAVLKFNRNKINNIPILVSLVEQTDMSQVYVGPNRINPKSAEFQLFRRDRHGLVFADLNGDDISDLFIVRGGLKGTLESFQGAVNDELLIRNASDKRFYDEAESRGIAKRACPARQTAAVDYNGDGLLDLYVSCGRPTNPSRFAPNQLYQQYEVGKFRHAAKAAGLDLPGEGTFVWLDADLDGANDLLWASTSGWQLLKNDDGVFRSASLFGIRDKANKFTVIDFDLDGDMDVFAAGYPNHLLINQGGDFELRDPLQFNLPKNSNSANWTDFDNDSLPDLHLLPQGLFKQREDRQFTKTNLLARSDPMASSARWEIANWVDINQDGQPDVVSAIEFLIRPPLSDWIGRHFGEIRPYINNGNDNFWLQVDLQGPTGNRHGVGATIVVDTGNKRFVRQVGHADGAHYSNSQYRTHFGLGNEDKIARLSVSWPDGYKQTQSVEKVNTIIRVIRPN